MIKNRYLGGRPKASRSKALMQAQIIYKQTHLKLDRYNNKMLLSSVCFGEELSLIADAECELIATIDKSFVTTLHGKESPTRLCQCGFYGYTDYFDAYKHEQNGDYAFSQMQRGHFTIKAIASGKMFEYKKGYRYGHQRVEEIIVSMCSAVYCSAPADRLMVDSENFLSPRCDRHLRGLIISFSKAEEIAGQSLPPEAPRIIVRSDNSTVIPWEPPTTKEPEVHSRRATFGGMITFGEKKTDSYLGVSLIAGIVAISLTGLTFMTGILGSLVQ